MVCLIKKILILQCAIHHFLMIFLKEKQDIALFAQFQIKKNGLKMGKLDFLKGIAKNQSNIISRLNGSLLYVANDILGNIFKLISKKWLIGKI